MNYYAFHIGDYAGATRHLSWDEDAAYRRLLDAYYVREMPIPEDKRQLYRLVQASSEQQREAVDVVLQEFFELREDGWHNKRCDAEIAAVREKSEKAARSAHKRWGNAPDAANALPTHEVRNANASSETCEGNAPNPNPNPNPKERNTARVRALTVDALVADGLSDQTAVEFLALRTKKRSPLTPRAWDGIKSEAAKARWTVEAAVSKALARGWTGFEADWVRDPRPPPNGEPAWAQEKRERMAKLAGPAAAKPIHTAEIIDVTTVRLG